MSTYTTPTYLWYRKTKNYLSKKGVSYLGYDVAQNKKKSKEMVERLGQMSVPVIVIGSEIIIGFNQGKLDKLLSWG